MYIFSPSFWSSDGFGGWGCLVHCTFIKQICSFLLAVYACACWIASKTLVGVYLITVQTHTLL